MGKAEKSYNTNLSAEYHVMSLLCRFGKEAYLSLGNKKGVDILIRTAKGGICIVEVKGNSKKYDWLLGNTGEFRFSDELFYALVCFNGKIDEVGVSPDIWVIPSTLLSRKTEYKIAKNGKTVFLSHKYIEDNYSSYKNTFKALEGFLSEN